MSNLRPFIHPVPIVVIGVNCGITENKANFTTVGDIAIAGLQPPLLMLSLHERHLSRETIDKTAELTVHVPEIRFLEKVDYCGVVSGHETDKSGVFSHIWHGNLPVIEEMPINLLCKVRSRVQIEKRVIYVIEVTEQIFRSDFTPRDFSELKTILYGLDNRYYQVGEPAENGYFTAKK